MKQNTKSIIDIGTNVTWVGPFGRLCYGIVEKAKGSAQTPLTNPLKFKIKGRKKFHLHTKFEKQR